MGWIFRKIGYIISQGVYGGNLSRYGVNLWMFLGIIFRFDISLKVWSGSLKVFGKHFTEYLAFLSRCPTCSQGLMHLSTYWTYTLQVSYISQGMGNCRTYDTSPRFGKNMSGLRRFSHGVLNKMIAWLTQTVNRLNNEPRVWWTKSCEFKTVPVLCFVQLFQISNIKQIMLDVVYTV